MSFVAKSFHISKKHNRSRLRRMIDGFVSEVSLK